MVKRHLIRIAAPRTWPLKRKEAKFIKRPLPGGHTFEYCIPLSFAVRDLLSFAETMKEVKFILKKQVVSVNGKRVHETARQIGLYDVLGFEETKKYYRLLINKKNKLFLYNIPESEKELLIGKVTRKTMQDKKVQTAHLHNGFTLTPKSAFKTNDTLVFQVKNPKVETQVLPYKEGSLVYIIGGKNAGLIATIKEIIKHPMRDDDVIITVGKQDIVCAKKHTFVIGKDKPVISLPITENKIQ